MPNENRRSYIVTDELLLNGEPIIRGNKNSRAEPSWSCGDWAFSLRKIPTHLPHIGLAQVFDALRYYVENQLQINQYIEINRVPEEPIHPAPRRERLCSMKLFAEVYLDEEYQSLLPCRCAGRGFDVLTARDDNRLGRQIQFMARETVLDRCIITYNVWILRACTVAPLRQGTLIRHHSSLRESPQESSTSCGVLNIFPADDLYINSCSLMVPAKYERVQSRILIVPNFNLSQFWSGRGTAANSKR